MSCCCTFAYINMSVSNFFFFCSGGAVQLKVPLMYVSTSLMRLQLISATRLTRGRVPRHNETFGCRIQNLTGCIKAVQTADAKGAARPKWWLPISYQVHHVSLCLQLRLQPSKSPNCAAAVPLFGHRILLFVTLDTSVASEKSNIPSCHWCFAGHHQLEILELIMKKKVHWFGFFFLNHAEAT